MYRRGNRGRINHYRTDIRKRRFNNNNNRQKKNTQRIRLQNKPTIYKPLPVNRIKQFNQTRNDTKPSELNKNINNVPKRTKNTTSNIFSKTLVTNLKIRKFNNNNIIDLVLNPYKMVLSNEYYSIFPTQLKVIRMGYYFKWTYNMVSGKRVLWYPYGVGFQKMFNEHHIVTTEQKQIDMFSNLFMSHLSDNTKFHAIPVTCSSIPGKYRLIGATLKCTNVTPATNKAGTVFIAKSDDDHGGPFYTAIPQGYEFPTIVQNNQTSNSAYGIQKELNLKLDNAPVKNTAPGTATIIINEVNNKEGNNIFNSYDEYNNVAYGFGSTLDQSEQRDTGGIANNTKYMLTFEGSGDGQMYLFEMWTVIEVCPLPETGFGGMAHDSSKGVSKRINKIINDTSNIRIIY